MQADVHIFALYNLSGIYFTTIIGMHNVNTNNDLWKQPVHPSLPTAGTPWWTTTHPEIKAPSPENPEYALATKKKYKGEAMKMKLNGPGR